MQDFATILRSPSFKVLVGEDRTCLTIHKYLAKDISPALHALMNNKHMVEAHDGLAVLDDIEADIFVGFCEFAYTGDYRSRITERGPEVGADDPAPIRKEEAPAMPEDIWGTWKTGEKKGKTQATKIERMWDDFLHLTYEDPPPLVSDEQATLVNGNSAPAPKTTISLFYHAKIYVFAEKYLIDNLRILCLRKLHAALQSFDLTLQTSGLLLEVLEFTYDHTERKESRDDELRMLLIHYAACKREILKQDPNLRSLLEANGEMACDLLYKQWGYSV